MINIFDLFNRQGIMSFARQSHGDLAGAVAAQAWRVEGGC
jgi:hypothetical protein